MSESSLKKGRYTKFSNKIGLYSNSKGGFIKNDTDVVLNFPFKDAVLEAGMSKEDVGREERFLHIEVDSKDIDTLEEPKVLTDFRYIDKDGEKTLDASSDIEFFDTEGNLKQNLLIKGNNLLALYTLRERLAGQVKLIYIDPPFYFSDNKSEDAFKYNSNFKLSTWLTFMRNRLEVANELLSEYGIFIVHVGVEDSAYINVLMDEIFGHENFINHIAITTNDASGFKATGQKIFSTANHIFIYKKNLGELNKIYIPKPYDKAYKFVITNKEEHYSKWQFTTIKQKVLETSPELKDAELDVAIEEFASNNPSIVFRTAAIGGGAKIKRIATIEKSKNNKGVVMQHPDEDIEGFFILNGEGIVFWKNTYKEIDGKLQPAQALTDIWTDIKWTGIANEGGVTLKNGKKPEKLMKRIIELATSENDIVMDYHLGSSTTVAVAHKMNRRWNGIKKMDYIN